MNLNDCVLALSLTAIAASAACHGTPTSELARIDGGGTPVTPVAPSDGGVVDATPPVDGSACNTTVAWSKMLAAQIIPGQSWANLNTNHDGPGIASEAYAESVNCPLVLTPEDGGLYYGPLLDGCWGDDADVCVSFYEGNTDIARISVTGAYSGLIIMTSRAGGAFGDNHLYYLGVGRLERDGQPMLLDWNVGTGLNELYDAFVATYYPCVPPVDDCMAAGLCLVAAADPDAGLVDNYFGVRPATFYAAFAPGADAPYLLYNFFLAADPADPGPHGPGVCPADAGIAPPLDAGYPPPTPDASYPPPGDASIWG